jgi:ATP/maltotriose-dependent transcriptional regulator MalT
VPEFTSVGGMLRYLRRRARLTQRELGLAVGYTESHISRLEQDQRRADPTALAALFVPALGLDREPTLAERLLALAASRDTTAGPPGVPEPPPHPVLRAGVLAELRHRLATERRVAVCGLPGMGKTTLAAMLARDHEPGTAICWLTVTAGVTASADALVRHLAGFLRAHGHAEGRRLLAGRDRDGPLPLDEQLGLLAAGLGRQPVLVCVDNAHLLAGDPAATAVLAHLAATTPAALLLTASEELAVPGVGTLRLSGLARHEARALIGGGVAPDLAERLIDRTGGSPMLLRLAVGELRARPDPAALVNRLESEPQVTAYLLATTLSGLTNPAWRVLSLLAVFRRPVDLYDERLAELVQPADGPYNLSAALDELRRRHLVDHPASAVLHPLVHDQVYARLVADLPRRRRLHAVAAAWSEQACGDVLEASYHCGRAGEPERAARLLVGHPAALVRCGQALAAADVAERLLVALPPAGDRTALLGVRGDLLADTVRAAEAEDAYRQALATADRAARPRLAWRLARLLSQRGRPAEAVEVCAAAARAADPADHLLGAQLAATRAQALISLARYDDGSAEAAAALDRCDRATDAAADADPATVAEVRARAHATLGQVMRVHRRFIEATGHLEQAVDAAVRADRPELAGRARYVLANVLQETGEVAAAEALYGEVLVGCERVGDSYGAARVLQALTHIHLNRGELALALKTIDRSRAIRSQLGSPPDIANADTVRAEVLLTLGRTVEARELIDAVVATPGRPGSTWERGYHLAVLAQAQLVAAEFEAAAGTLRGALALPGLDGTALRLLLRAYLAVALYLLGCTAEADDLLDPADQPVSPGVRLDLLVRDVVRAATAGDAIGAAGQVTGLAEYARTHGHRRYEAVAGELSAALSAGVPVAELPRLVWGGGTVGGSARTVPMAR